MFCFVLFYFVLFCFVFGSYVLFCFIILFCFVCFVFGLLFMLFMLCTLKYHRLTFIIDPIKNSFFFLFFL